MLTILFCLPANLLILLQNLLILFCFNFRKDQEAKEREDRELRRLARRESEQAAEEERRNRQRMRDAHQAQLDKHERR